MSFFDDASLVMIPSGYKTSKVYSVKPTDGSGDLAFTRSNSTATRVGPDGLIEKVRTNLVLQSEAFNTTWVPASVSVTANTTANPLNGALTADTITLTGATAPKYITQTIIYGGSTTTSVYLKAGTHQFVQICLGTDPTPFANFDLVNGTASATGSTASIVSAGGGFFRCSMAATSIIGTDIIILAVDSLAATRFVSTASTGTFIAFGAQIETGDIATPYIATTTAAVSVGPVANVPRLDYLNSSCPRLLLEPQRTNLATYSEQFNNAAYTPLNITVIANNTISPSGTTSADKVIPTTSNTFHLINSNNATSSGNYTFSLFVKAAGLSKVSLRESATVGFYASFDLTNQTILDSSSSQTNTITSVGNGWYRITSTRNYAGTINLGIIPLPNSYTSGDPMTSYAGDGTSGIFVWGAQIEVGAYATSYIPTLGASVTRGADAASKTGISSLIGQTEGTLYGELKVTAYDPNGFIPVYLKNSAGSNEVYVWFQTDGRIRGRVYTASAAQADIFTATGFATVGGTYKFALAYKQNDFAFYVNGQQIGTDTSGTVGATSEFYFTYAQLADFSFPLNIDQTLIFPTRLSNADLAALTA